jgi:hypothetical protein
VRSLLLIWGMPAIDSCPHTLLRDVVAFGATRAAKMAVLGIRGAVTRSLSCSLTLSNSVGSVEMYLQRNRHAARFSGKQKAAIAHGLLV